MIQRLEPEPFDVAVVGGGPAGSTVATLLARTGQRVVLLEREHFPRDKLCGEFLSPESLPVLQELGCLDAVVAAGASRVSQARFSTPAGRVVETSLPGDGFGISRRVFDSILLKNAVTSGVSVREGTEVIRVEGATSSNQVRRVTYRCMENRRREESVVAALVIGAYGREGRLEQTVQPVAGAPRRHRKPLRVRRRPLFVGVKRHHRFAPTALEGRRALERTVEVHLVRGGYCGIVAIQDQLVNVCAFLRASFIKRLESSRWETLALALGRQNPLLAERLATLIPEATPTLTIAAGAMERTRSIDSDFPRVGDAAGMISPLCGDGQAMALDSARALARRLTPQPGTDVMDKPWRGAAWHRQWEKEYGTRLRVGGLLQAALLRPRMAELVVATAAGWPGLSDALVRWTRGS